MGWGIKSEGLQHIDCNALFIWTCSYKVWMSKNIYEWSGDSLYQQYNPENAGRIWDTSSKENSLSSSREWNNGSIQKDIGEFLDQDL